MWIRGGWLECSWREKRWGDGWVINQSGCVKGLQIQSALWNGEGKWAPHIYSLSLPLSLSLSLSLTHTHTHTPFYLFLSQFLSHTHIHTQSRSRSLSLYKRAHSLSLSLLLHPRNTTHSLTAVTSFIASFVNVLDFIPISHKDIFRFSALICFHSEFTISFRLKTRTEDCSGSSVTLRSL